ncbi:D-aminoacyl-tRNA deacylase isoform X1 [Selaginella moellendorffii]|uniref:D-aminoacyl-tRNA deacylase isoform X1 n=1 Tax=Selaginella moellendorffii TaxID=88036 RepID=UPI000D1CB276|nr:D-aminoacyl-tRNA deacylase isoform X1 [Selaginella moellendorffii]|eukprot:XP_024524449.1 D-aminoacyl-tRNA deacylase isoform X1 [Selaginella moellendorffii]
MRAVVQRVLSARVEVDGQVVSQIGQGLLVLVGISESDTKEDADFLCRKILNMRLFVNDKTGKAWDQNVMQKNFDVLLGIDECIATLICFFFSFHCLVSQFTLYGFLKGNKPDFHLAMPPLQAKDFYSKFVEAVAHSYSKDKVKDGIFGALMQVHLVNDGPVTLQLDSRKPGDENNHNSSS